MTNANHPNRLYGFLTTYPCAHDMLHRISESTYIDMNNLIGMYIANEACAFATRERKDYWDMCMMRMAEAEGMMLCYEPPESTVYYGRIRVYEQYLAKLREMAWEIHVPLKDYLGSVIVTEYNIFANSTRESYMARLGRYMDEMSEVYDLRVTGTKSDFVPAIELKKDEGGDTQR